MKNLFTTRNLCVSGIIAALYAALTIINPWGFGPVQVRFSEALTILPMFTPAAIPGLFVGVLVSNLVAGYGMVDIIFGSLATLIAAYLTCVLGKKILFHEVPKFLIAAFPPIILNALIVGWYLYWWVGFSETYSLWFIMGFVGIGQIIACYGLGGVLYFALKRTKIQLK